MEKIIVKKFIPTSGTYVFKSIGGINNKEDDNKNIKIIYALNSNNSIEQITTNEGILNANAYIPQVRVENIGIYGMNCIKNNNQKNTDNYLLKEVKSIISSGNIITKQVCDKILMQTQDKTKEVEENVGEKYEENIDYIFI